MRKQSFQFKLSISLLVLAIVGLVAALTISAMPVFASGQSEDVSEGQGEERFVTIYDKNARITIKTSAATVQEALARAEISVDSSDVVEPALDEEILADNFRINIYRARPVIIVDGLRKIRFMTAQTDPSAVALAANLDLRSEDVVKITTQTNFLESGVAPVYEVTRARALNFSFYGTNAEIYTQATTVQELLDERNIVLTEADWLSLAPTASLIGIAEIGIYRQGVNTVTLEEDVPYSTQTVYDYDRAAGYKAITQQGLSGKKTTTYEIFMQDGVEQSRTLIASMVTQEPIEQIEVVGAKSSAPAVTLGGDKIAIMRAAGVAESDFAYATYIIDHENASWCPIRWQGRKCADTYYEKFTNAESSSEVGYGLCQATPGNKMASAGSDWRTNVVTQMKWCASYAIGRYGTWEKAYNFKKAKGWW